jgi:ribonuclease-3
MINKLAGWFSGNSTTKTNFKVDIQTLQKTIKYEFKNHDLLIQAVSHRSYYIDSEQQLYSNERLEFLGDAVLELIATEFLYTKFKKENEGNLSQKKAILVSRKVLGKISNELGLGEFLILNKGEEKTGGRTRLSNLANLFEAILGAIYLDSGFNSAKNFVVRFLLDRQKELLKTKTFFNYKSYLLEFSQSKNWGAPQYTVVEESGPDHQKLFLIEVCVNKKWKAVGKGPNKKSAEQKAAKNTLKVMSEEFLELGDIFKT